MTSPPRDRAVRRPRVRPEWYFTSPVQPRSMRYAVRLLMRVLELGQDLRVRLLQDVRSTLRRPRWAMPSSTLRAPPSAASAMTSSRTGTIMSSPSIEKRVLPGKVRCRNRSNASTCVMRSSSSNGSIGSGGGRNVPDLGGVRAATRALRGRRSPRSRSRSWSSTPHAIARWPPARSAAPAATAPPMRLAGNRSRSSSVTPCDAGLSEGSPTGGSPSGSICAARWPYRRIDSASPTAPTIACIDADAPTSAPPGGGPGRVGRHPAREQLARRRDRRSRGARGTGRTAPRRTPR